jgi:hypothetical protein
MMPVSVHIPIRIKVDPGALRELRPALEEAFVAAVGRALGNSRKVVVEERGGYMGIRLAPPDVTWSGDGLHAVHEADRTEIEEMLSSALFAAAGACGLLQLAGAPQRVPAPLSGHVEEMLDQDRYSSLLGVYAIPSHDREGEPVAVPVDPDKAPLDEAGLFEVEWQWRTIDPSRELREAIHVEMGVRGLELPERGYLGIIFQRADGRKYLSLLHLPDQGEIATAPLTGLFRLELSGEGKDARFRQAPVAMPPRALYRIRWYARGQSREDRVDAYRRFFGEFLKETIRARAERLSTKIKRSEFSAQLEIKVEKILAEMVDRLERTAPETRSFLELTVDGTHCLLQTGLDLPADLDTELIPIVDFREARAKERKPTEAGAEPGPPAVPGPGEGTGGRHGRGAAGVGEETTGEGLAGREDAGPPGFVVVPGAPAEEAGAPLYPPSLGKGELRECSPLLGEPALEQLGEDGGLLRQSIREIAAKLQIEPCEYAACFCLMAAEALSARAAAVTRQGVTETGFTMPVGAGRGNLGLLEFTPTTSPAIQFFRHLAGVVPLITRLSSIVRLVYAKPEHRGKIQGHWGHDPSGWSLHFLMELTPEMKSAVAYMFAATCQIILLQILRSSREQIQARLNRMDQYAAAFEQVIVPSLMKIEEITRLRERLRSWKRLDLAERTMRGVLPSGRPGPNLLAVPMVQTSWLLATRDLTEMLKAGMRAPQGRRGVAGEVLFEGDEPRIWDSAGCLWTEGGLESAMVVRRGLIESVDPLVKQLVDLDEVLDRFRNRGEGVRGELENILREMLAHNQEMLEKTEASWEFAFRAGKIRENLKARTVPGTSFALDGVHLLAHDQIGDFFRGDPHYAIGINALFNWELGAQSIKAFFEYGALILLAVFCPPAAFVAGAALSLRDYGKATERERLYQSLIDPELVLTRAEVEMDLFAARLGVALSFVPEVGSILGRGAALAVRLGARGTARAAAGTARGLYRAGPRKIGAKIGKWITSSTAESLKHGVSIAFLREIATDQFMDRFLTLMIHPIIESLEREIAVAGSQGGISGAQRTLRRLGLQQTRQAEERRP